MQRIPTILTADEIIDKAFRKASKVDIIGKSKVDMIRQKNIIKVNAIASIITSELRAYVKAFPSIDNLPPFYNEMIGLLTGIDELKKSIGAIDWCADQIERLGTTYKNKIKRLKIPTEIDALRAEMYGRTSSLVRQVDKNLRFLNKARNQIRVLPTIDPEMRTIVVAGAPNVGKSQLVAAISTAKPKVAIYPFTTKEITVGLLTVKRTRYQVIDTPGLLDRPLEERNDIERQAIIALRHLSDLVIFILDASGHCGYPLEYQQSLLSDIRKSYPNAKTIVIENKADLMKGKGENLRVSALTGEGIAELIEKIVENLSKKI